MTSDLSRSVRPPIAPLYQLAFGCLLALACAAHADTVEPGKASKKHPSIRQWTLDGPLGETPQRLDESLPLSDQANEGGWILDKPRSDEFNGESLDSRLWSPRHRSWRGREPAEFSPDNVEVSDGMLRLWMRKNGGERQGERDKFHTYTSAAVHAKQRSLYGYYEVRAKPMDSAGSSSFWFAGSGSGWRTEIDVFELGGKAIGHEHRYNMNLHVFHTPEERRHWSIGSHWTAPERLADAFHTYGLAWTPERITYYVDGVAVRWVENTHWHQPIYLIFDSETMIDWLGQPQDEDLPSDYQIDYVRIWQSPRAGTAPTASKERASDAA